MSVSLQLECCLPEAVPLPSGLGMNKVLSWPLKMEGGLLLDSRARPPFPALLPALILLSDSCPARQTHLKAKAASVFFLDFFFPLWTPGLFMQLVWPWSPRLQGASCSVWDYHTASVPKKYGRYASEPLLLNNKNAPK